MELFGFGFLAILGLGLVVGSILLWTRGVFNRDLTQALQRVQQQEQALQEKAEILEQRLTQMERDYQTKLKRAEGETERLLQDAKTQAMNIRTVAIEEAKHRARQLLLEAEQGRVQLRAEVAKELDGHIIQRACESLRSLLSPVDLASLHRRLTTELLDALQQLESSARRSGTEAVHLRAGQTLGPGEVERVQRWVTSTFGADVPLRVETDTGLVAGCVLQFGDTIVDSSLPNRLGRQ
ncbi:MAG: hypothetical protein COV75_07130 [Candidatus Omnitrophica bacterium CG11_big_fil_rev_8_21_14_0_20_63_9]|nr:MAG: hypothetical protein COV75_07130 [Candidatus Omnitrophica bacterium CG11_big_fil_rev_8_21_14_0_20_63_9]